MSAVRIADYGDMMAAYDRDPLDSGAVWLAEAVKAQPAKGDMWRGWRVGDGSGTRRGLCSDKRTARTDLRAMAEAVLAERAVAARPADAGRVDVPTLLVVAGLAALTTAGLVAMPHVGPWWRLVIVLALTAAVTGGAHWLRRRADATQHSVDGGRTWDPWDGGEDW